MTAGAVVIKVKDPKPLYVNGLQRLKAYKVVGSDNIEERFKAQRPADGDIVVKFDSNTVFNCTTSAMINVNVLDRLHLERAHEIESITLTWDNDR